MTDGPLIRALLVGVDKPHDWPPPWDLGGAAKNDVDAVADLLKHEFEARDVHRLVGPEATKKAIADAIRERVAGASREGDIAVFYFAGHGIKQGDGGVCLAAFDTAWVTEENKRNPVVRESLLEVNDLVQDFSPLASGVRIEAIFDTCFAGGAASRWTLLSRLSQLPPENVVSFFRRLGVRNPASVQAKIEKALRGRTYVLWLSSSPDVESHQQFDEDTQKSRGAFTLALENSVRKLLSENPSRAKMLGHVRTDMKNLKQNPGLAPSDEGLRRHRIFAFRQG